MRSHTVVAAVAGICVGWLCALSVAAQDGVAPGGKSRYWEWGWGTYGAGSTLDTARFDWSIVTPTDPQRAAAECNEILAVNPAHKFLVRVWPILGLGDCPENRQQATLMHYLYQPGTREKVLAVIRQQVTGLLEGLDKPASFAGSVFLEELPCHFSSAPFRQDWSALAREWGIGQEDQTARLPWDIRRFHAEIQAELGEPFDILSEKHRRWWGEKYAGVLAEIHREMKTASGGRIVLYWHQTMFNTMDHLEEGQSIFTPGVVPVRYEAIVKPGLCDGIFGYPNSAHIWSRQTVAVVEKLNCLLFSQLAQRPTLRLSRFDEQVALARWEHPGNLGTFLFPTAGRRYRAWNQLPYPEAAEASTWTVREYSRRFAWDYKIGLDVVAALLTPRLGLDYSLAGLKTHGFVHVQAEVYNPRDPSWYGGDAAPTVLNDVRVTLEVPTGFSIPIANNAGATLPLGDLGPQECMPADWWVRLDKDDPAIPAGEAFRLRLTVNGAPSTTAESGGAESRIAAFGTHPVSGSGATWIESAYHVPADYVPVAEIRALMGEVVHPRLGCGERSVAYRGSLRAKDRLVIGPGVRATLFREPLLAHRFPADAGRDGAVFSTGYHVHSTARASVRPEGSYRLRVSGWARDGGNCHVIARFTGQRAGNSENVDQSCLAGRFSENSSTQEVELTVPAFDGDNVSVVFYFYRLQSKGTVCYEAYELRSLDVPEQGLDVTDRIDGILAGLDRPFTVWRYTELADPNRYGDAKAEIRFLPPDEVRALPGTP